MQYQEYQSYPLLQQRNDHLRNLASDEPPFTLTEEPSYGSEKDEWISPKNEYFAKGILPSKQTYSHAKHKKIVDQFLLSESPSCSRLKKQELMKSISPRNREQTDHGFHKSRVYSNYKYPSMEREFNHESLNNSCDSIKNKLGARLRNFQFQLYRRKYHPEFELSTSTIQQITSKEEEQMLQQQHSVGNLTSPIRFVKKNLTLEQAASGLQSNTSPRSNSLHRNLAESSFITQTDNRSSQQASPMHSFPTARTETEELKQQYHIPASLCLPPIFAAEVPLGGIADKFFGKARILSKGKLFNEYTLNKDIMSTSGEKLVSKSNNLIFQNSALRFAQGSDNKLNLSNKLSKNKQEIEPSATIAARTFEGGQKKRTDDKDPDMYKKIPRQQKRDNTSSKSQSNQIGELIRLNANEISEAMNSIRRYFWGTTLKPTPFSTMSESNLRQEFLRISGKTVTNNSLNSSQNEEGNPTDPEKDAYKNVCVSLKSLQERFQIFSSDPNLQHRIWDCLINIHLKPEDLNESAQVERLVTWSQFKSVIEIVATKSASIHKFSSFLSSYFNSERESVLDQKVFLEKLKFLCQKVDKFVDPSSKKSIYSTFEQNFYLLGLLKLGRVSFSSTSLHNVFLTKKANHLELVDLILESF